MENQLAVFEGREIMVLLPEDVSFQFKGDFLIRAKDVAVVLEYASTQKLTDVVKEKYLVLVKNFHSTKTVNWKLHNNGEVFLTSFGLNQALSNSTMPKAEPFQDWLYEKVLPSIQKHGKYEILPDPACLEDLIISQTKLISMQAQSVKELKAEVKQLKDSQEVINHRMNNLDAVNIDGTPRQRLEKIIKRYAWENGVQYKTAWRDFDVAYNLAYRSNLTALRENYSKRQGLREVISRPAYLEAEGKIEDGIRIADKLLNKNKMAI